jgi:acetyltransferase
MNIKKLHNLFNPKNIAIIGASNNPISVGYSLVKNLVSSGFEGTVYPVNTKHTSIQGVKAYQKVSDLPEKADLALIATPAISVPEVVEECGQSGVSSIVIVSAGFREIGEEGNALLRQIEEKIKKYDLSILGPNCMGFIRPAINLNASFSRKMAKKGGIAFISQSGALCSSILDWSLKENVGFSYFVSVGEMIDIGFHDLIDYFGRDESTTSILIYMESLQNARRFMSATRSFTRTKPIIILKAGKSQEGAMAALSHTGSLTGNDQVFDAAFKRAGAIRVNRISELFDCAKTLSMQRRPVGDRLAIITNAGGPGVIATDELIGLWGKLAKLSTDTTGYLSEFLPKNWSHGNPIDILGDADPIRYKKAVESCMNDSDVDGILVILTPQAMTDAIAIAKEIVTITKHNHKTLLACFMGEDDVMEGRKILEENGIPAYEKPEDAVRTFMSMYNYDLNLKLLYETPGTIPHAFSPKTDLVKNLLDKAVSMGTMVLTEPDAKRILSFYDIPIPKGELVKDIEKTSEVALRIGFPLAAKIVSPQIIHKFDIGGVILDIKSPQDAKKAYEEIIQSAKKHMPQAQIDGIYFEEMVNKKYEILIGSKKDPIFGPVIIFGLGGVAVEVFKDINIGLPPLNMTLSKRLIEGTKIYKLLKGYRGAKGIDLEALQFMLYKLAYLVMDFSEIKELDINPFAVYEKGDIVLDAKIILDEKLVKKETKPYSHMVISPYPREYEKHIQLESGQSVFLRPIKPEDEPMEAEMFRTFSEQTQRFRFFGLVKEISHEMLIRYTQIDYDREIAIIAEKEVDGNKKMLGVVRLIADPYNETAEFALVIGDPWQKQGLGNIMMDYILEIAGKRGIKKVFAYVLEDNSTMIHMFEDRKFQLKKEEDMLKAELNLL